jgi:hypothetical protein
MKQSKISRQFDAELTADKTGHRQYQLDSFHVEECMEEIRGCRSRFIQRFGKLRIHAITTLPEHGIIYCAYDKNLQRIAFFIPRIVGLYIDEHAPQTRRAARREEAAKALAS